MLCAYDAEEGVRLAVMAVWSATVLRDGSNGKRCGPHVVYAVVLGYVFPCKIAFVETYLSWRKSHTIKRPIL